MCNPEIIKAIGEVAFYLGAATGLATAIVIAIGVNWSFPK